MIRFVVMFMILALAVAGAETYTVQVFQPIQVGSTALKAGDYKIEHQGDKITIKNGKISVEASVTVENLPEKVNSTRLILNQKGDRLELAAISLRGTKTRLVLQ